MTFSPYSNFGYATLSTQRDRAPDAPALTYRGTEHLTYSELDRLVNKMANALLAAGLVPGERVATLLDSTMSVAQVYFAQSKIGSVLCALNPFWTPSVHEQIVSRIDATTFVYDAKFDDLVAELRPRLRAVERWVRIRTDASDPVTDTVDLNALLASATPEAPSLGAGGDDLMALFFTSGTTGLPKAVQYTHASALAIARGLWLDVPAGRDATLGTGPIIWGVGFIAVAAPAIAAGIRLALEDNFGPARFLEAVPRERITHISVTPSFFSELLSSTDHETVDLSTLRVAMLGGEPLLPSLQAKITRRLPNLALFGYYGQTEAPYSVIARRDDGGIPDGVVGWARSDGAVCVVDSSGVPVIERVGEIRIRGPHVMAGYDHQPEATAEALRDGWFVGGDVGSIDRDGRLSVLGRRSDAIERGGDLVLPAQIEDAASRIEGVAEAGAVGIPVPGDSTRILLAIAPEKETVLDPVDIAEKLSYVLPLPARPDKVVITDELPHANDGSGGKGKLLRRALVEQFGSLFESTPVERT